MNSQLGLSRWSLESQAVHLIRSQMLYFYELTQDSLSVILLNILIVIIISGGIWGLRIFLCEGLVVPRSLPGRAGCWSFLKLYIASIFYHLDIPCFYIRIFIS
jgi:hypothetical protein